MSQWEVPYREEFSGTVIVEAATAEEAEELVRQGHFDSDVGAERVNWELTGKAKPWD